MMNMMVKCVLFGVWSMEGKTSHIQEPDSETLGIVG